MTLMALRSIEMRNSQAQCGEGTWVSLPLLPCVPLQQSPSLPRASQHSAFARAAKLCDVLAQSFTVTSAERWESLASPLTSPLNPHFPLLTLSCPSVLHPQPEVALTVDCAWGQSFYLMGRVWSAS